MGSLFELNGTQEYVSYESFDKCRYATQALLNTRHPKRKNEDDIRVKAVVILGSEKILKASDQLQIQLTEEDVYGRQDEKKNLEEWDFAYVVIYKRALFWPPTPSQICEWGYISMNWLWNQTSPTPTPYTLYRHQCLKELPSRPFFPSGFHFYHPRYVSYLKEPIAPLLVREALETRMVLFFFLRQPEPMWRSLPDAYWNVLFLETPRGIILDAIGFYLSVFLATRSVFHTPGITDLRSFRREWRFNEERLLDVRLRGLSLTRNQRPYDPVHFPILCFTRAQLAKDMKKKELACIDSSSLCQLFAHSEWFEVALIPGRRDRLFKGGEVIVPYHRYAVDLYRTAFARFNLPQCVLACYELLPQNTALLRPSRCYRDIIEYGNQFLDPFRVLRHIGIPSPFSISSPMQMSISGGGAGYQPVFLNSNILELRKNSPACVQMMISRFQYGSARNHLKHTQRQLAFRIFLGVGLAVTDIEDLVKMGGNSSYPSHPHQVKSIVNELKWWGKKGSNLTNKVNCVQLKSNGMCGYTGASTEPCIRRLNRATGANYNQLYNPHFYISCCVRSTSKPSVVATTPPPLAPLVPIATTTKRKYIMLDS
jgi:hypothetical protein